MNEARYTRNLEAAKAALAAGFKSAAAQKDAADSAARAYEEVREGISSKLLALPDEKRGEDWDAAYWAAPQGLHLWNEKAKRILLNFSGELAPLVAMIPALVELRAAIKAAPIVKPETKKAATERKVAEVKEAVAAGVASPIALAIAPLRENAAAAAREWAEKVVASAKDKLAAAGFDLDIVVPPVDRNATKVQRAIADEARAHYGQFLKLAANGRATWDYSRGARFIAQSVSDTEASFDSFVLKLDGKVGDHTAATLISGATWGYSILRVILADGTVQHWKTQQIVNSSSLGRLFNQWPTRLMK